jgi:hypothetical protein
MVRFLAGLLTGPVLATMCLSPFSEEFDRYLNFGWSSRSVLWS